MPCAFICIKQDINFLEYPLWFQNMRHDGIGFIWSDIEGFEYRTGYKLPDKVDILVLLYLMYKSQNNDYQTKITLSRYEILKGCGLSSENPNYYKRIEESLKRWENVALEFRGTFYNHKEYISIGFHIIDSYEIEKDTKKIAIFFNENWLLKIKESRYFRLINFERYKALKRPLSRRLFELLDKSFLGRDEWEIHLTKLGNKLPVYGRQTKRGKIIYASDVLIAIKPAINEINKLSHDPEICKKLGLKPEEIFTITYEITGVGQDRIIHFHRHPVFVVQEKGQEKAVSNELQSLLSLLKKRSTKLDKVIAQYAQKQGLDYVKWNILYANEKAKKNYSTYLQGALEKNWAEEWAEEERIRIEIRAKKEAEEKRLREESKKVDAERVQLDKEKPCFLQKLTELDNTVKIELWEKADSTIAPAAFRRENMVKIAYLGLLCQYLNEHGESFSQALANDFRLAVNHLSKPME